MNHQRFKFNLRLELCAASAAVLCLAATGTVCAQDAGRPLGGIAPDPNPYYLGVSQGFTHDSNVYLAPSGPADTYSSTSVFGGFSQPISRQRIFGRAAVSLNRFFDQQPLNNTSYDLSTGAELATVQNISGSVNLSASQRLAAPVATTGVPGTVRNVAQTERADARLRWGGPSVLSVEGALGYTRVDF
jgi:hypothetical protein